MTSTGCPASNSARAWTNPSRESVWRNSTSPFSPVLSDSAASKSRQGALYDFPNKINAPRAVGVVLVEEFGRSGQIFLDHFACEPPGLAIALGDQGFDEPVRLLRAVVVHRFACLPQEEPGRIGHVIEQAQA